MNSNETPNPTPPRNTWLRRSVQAWSHWAYAALKARAGHSVVEYVIVAGIVGVLGIAGFRRFGLVLNSNLKKEAEHIEGKGMPRVGDLNAELAQSLDPRLATFNCSAGYCTRPDGCFVAGTPVATSEGLPPIESIRPGELVWSRSELTGDVSLRPVTYVTVSYGAPVVQLVLTHPGGATEQLHATYGHPFWAIDQGWQRADQLTGEAVLSPVGPLTVASVAAAPAPVAVYNLEVAEYHSYFVGWSAAWVHNIRALGQDDCSPETGPESSAESADPGNRTGGEDPAQSGAVLPANTKEEEECRERMEKLGPTFKKNPSKKWRPETPEELGAEICKLACPNGIKPEACEKAQRCVFEKAGAHEYNTRWEEGVKKKLVGYLNDCLGQDEPLCFKARMKEQESLALSKTSGGTEDNGGEIDRLCKEREKLETPEENTAEKAWRKEQKDKSEELGEAAARAYARTAYPDHTCIEAKHANVFDLVCYKEGPKEVVIIEAKGGTAGLGSRLAEPGGSYRVQQGTRAYVKAVVAAMKRSPNPGELTNIKGGDAIAKGELAEMIGTAEKEGNISYIGIRQGFDCREAKKWVFNIEKEKEEPSSECAEALGQTSPQN